MNPLQVDLNTSQVWSQNHSFYKESEIEAASYEICALKYSLGASVSRDFLVIQLGPKSVFEKNIWSKSNETIHAFKLYFSFYETGKDNWLDNCGNEFRNHLLFVGSPMLLVSKILLKLRFNWIHNCSGNQLKRENCVSCRRDPNKVLAQPIRVEGFTFQQVPTKIILYNYIVYHYQDYII